MKPFWLIFFMSTIYGQDLPISTTGLESENGNKICVLADIQSKNSNNLELTENDVLNKIELKFRSVGIEPSNNIYMDGCLIVKIFVVGQAFNVSLEFSRWVSIRTNKKIYLSKGTTWSHSTTGTHGGNSSYILDSVGELADYFLNAYLKANPRNK